MRPAAVRYRQWPTRGTHTPGITATDVAAGAVITVMPGDGPDLPREFCGPTNTDR